MRYELAPHVMHPSTSRATACDDDPLATEVKFSVTHVARQMAAIVRRDERDGVWRCRYCRTRVVQLDKPGIDHSLPYPERDHVVPRARGGSNDITNLVLACADCNKRKGSTALAELPPGWMGAAR